MLRTVNVVLLTAACIALFGVGSKCQAAAKLSKFAKDDYKAEWQKVDSLLKTNLPKSALEIVEKLYLKANAAGNQAQIIKTTSYRVGLRAELTDEGDTVVMNELVREINRSPEPTRSVLTSVYAEAIWQYYQRNRWKFSQRTTVVEQKPEDFRTWDIRTLFDTSRTYYMKSLHGDAMLKSQKLEDLQAILYDYGVESKKWRPTLYDLLAHRALTFLRNEDNTLPRGEMEFQLETLDGLLPARQFSTFKFTSPDPDDAAYLSVTIYQRLIAFHLADADPDALMDIDLLRLSTLKAKTTHPDAESTYLNRLESLVQEYDSKPAGTMPMHALAQHWYNKDNVKARNLCLNAEKAFPKSRGGVDAKALRLAIEARSFTVNTESTVAADKPFLASITYRNVSKVHFAVYSYNRTRKRGSYYNSEYLNDEQLKKFLAGKPLKKWEQDLPDPGNYKNKTTYVRIPELGFGSYIIVASYEPTFSVVSNAIAYTQTHVTRLAINGLGAYRNDGTFYITDAVTGDPLQGVTVNYYKYKYDYKRSDYEEIKLASRTTDADGKVKYFLGDLRDNYKVEAVRGSDNAMSNRDFYYSSPGERPEQIRMLLFTDRGIYRPGQTIYFKGIVVNSSPDADRNSVVTGRSEELTFYDVNGQKITSANVKTNEFGSVSGSFIAPVGLLNGQMSIRCGIGGATFRVEEYKRPKFEAKFEGVKGEFKLNEKISVKGSAVSYAGSVIDGAKVQYRVFRKAQYPYWYWWWGPMPNASQKEIARGVIATDEKGEFIVEFVAHPDKSVPETQLPIFTYSVTADVTDINGETRTATTGVRVGYVVVDLSMSAPAVLDVTEECSPVVRTMNLNAKPLKQTGSIVLSKIKQPALALRSRVLAAPDTSVISEFTFKQEFPYDVYRNEDQMDSWEVEREIARKSFVTDTAFGADTIEFNKLQSGIYRVTVTLKDPSGRELRQQRYITVYDKNNRSPSVVSHLEVLRKNDEYQPGDVCEFVISSSSKSASVLMITEVKGKQTSEEWITLNSSQRKISIPIKEEHRGGFTVHLMSNNNYRLYNEQVQISVPWTNKGLAVEKSVFRSKLLPGQEETWKFTIKGPNKEKVGAEMVATMYDASLDAIAPHTAWSGFGWPTYYPTMSCQNFTFGVTQSINYQSSGWNPSASGYYLHYDALNLQALGRAMWGYSNLQYYADSYYDASPITPSSAPRNGGGDKKAMRSKVAGGLSKDAAEISADGVSPGGSAEESPNEPADEKDAAKKEDMSGVAARKNLNELAFFVPSIETNADGDFVISFTIPEALTRWHLRAFAHTADMKVGYLDAETVTQKDLMLLPNMPRFLRENDDITIPVKISNVTKDEMKGTAELQILDAFTMQPISADFKLMETQKPFTVAGNRSTVVTWNIKIPDTYDAVVYRVVAKAGNFSDGEEAPLPVLPNRMLVTETLPLWVRSNQTKSFTFDKLVKSGTSTTLKNHKLTLEMSSNPAWYAIQALPYLAEYPYECAEQVFNRYYANSIASFLVNSKPIIKRVFDEWRNTDALLSNLEKNQELKLVLLQETPWVMAGKNETERKKRVALLFDLNRMSGELRSAIAKLEKYQYGNGGFPWFPGMPESRYITQYIAAGIGHLRELGVLTDKDPKVMQMGRKAISYIETAMNRDYQELKRQKGFDPKLNYLSHFSIHYLYCRSFFKEIAVQSGHKEAHDFWMDQAKRFWMDHSLMSQGQVALALHRLNSDKVTPPLIMKSIKERSLSSEEMGMYWKMSRSWWWYEAPIETQAVLIEAFDEVVKDEKSVEEMKVWLLKQKQVQDWKTTIATAEACYALLRRGADWLDNNKLVEVTMGGNQIDPRKMDGVKVEAGTGYYKLAWNADEIKPKMGEITVKKDGPGIAWGGVYWQYYEQLDKITPSETPLSIKKQVYKQENTANGVVLKPITEQNPLMVGDLLKIRVEIRVDRAMEYVHLKDMRGAGFEPISQISRYKWQDGLGYYESMKDASANFFMQWLPKGVHVFEYALRVTHKGSFSNGITQIQCMYAPEFTSNSAGIRLNVQ